MTNLGVKSIHLSEFFSPKWLVPVSALHVWDRSPTGLGSVI